MKQVPKKRERGFALLLVFLLAAAAAFALYEEMPRVAFESARDKEQILMDRGNQYKRAIELYYAVNKRYPAELKDLENTNDMRFLRRRYIDPMTGKDDWRLIHTNGAALTDSLVQKPPAQNAANGTPANGVVPGGGPLGANSMNSAPAAAAADTPPPAIDPNTGQPVPVQTQNAAALRRPSDRGFSPGQLPVAGVAPTNPFAGSSLPPNGVNPNNFDPSDPRTWPPITLTSPTTPGTQQALNGTVPGQQPGTQVIPGQVTPQGNPGQFPLNQFQGGAPSGIPGQLPGLGGANPQPTFDPNNPAGLPITSSPPVGNQNQSPNQINGVPGNTFNQLLSQPPITAAPVSNPSPGVAPVQQPPPQFPFQQPTQAGPAAQPPPLQTAAGPQPQVGGPGGANPATQFINNQLFSPTPAGTAPGAANASTGPGIAGVASKFKGPSIKTYKKRTKYQEWEFVFEPAAQTAGPLPGNPANANPLGANPNGANPNGINSNGSGPNQGNSNPLGLMPFGSSAGSPAAPGFGPPATGQAPNGLTQ